MKNQLEITPLAEFCKRHKISRQQLSDIAGGDANDASKSTMQRLLHDRIEDADYVKRLRLNLAENLPTFLLTRGMTTAQINRELTGIFNDGEYKPMTTEKIELHADAQKWFGLNNDPFRLEPRNISEVFVSPELHEIFDRVIDTIHDHGFLAITDEIGSGKTVLRNWIQEEIRRKHNNIKFIFLSADDNETINPASIGRAILRSFDYGKIPIDPIARTEAVFDLLASKKDLYFSFCLDECHKLKLKTIASLKNILEMQYGFRRLTSIVLFGQHTPFDTKLTKLREIKERLSIIKMPEFKLSAVPYLAHRLALVGGKMEELFDADALELIKLNAQTPLQLGNIVNKAMLESMKIPYESKTVRGGIMRAKMTLANTKTERRLEAVGYFTKDEFFGKYNVPMNIHKGLRSE